MPQHIFKYMHMVTSIIKNDGDSLQSTFHSPKTIFDLICDVVFTTLSITKTTAFSALGVEIARGLHIGVILVFLAAEALVDQVNEDALTQVAKLEHTLQESFDSCQALLEAVVQLIHNLLSALNFRPGLLRNAIGPDEREDRLSLVCQLLCFGIGDNVLQTLCEG